MLVTRVSAILAEVQIDAKKITNMKKTVRRRTEITIETHEIQTVRIIPSPDQQNSIAIVAAAVEPGADVAPISEVLCPVLPSPPESSAQVAPEEPLVQDQFRGETK